MDGRAFLDVAQELAKGPTEAHRRTAAGRAYYALMLEARDLLERWGMHCPARDKVHHFVRLKLLYATDPDLKNVALCLEELGKFRNHADYDLSDVNGFFAPGMRFVGEAVDDARNAITLLGEIDGDVARRAAAIASLPPP